MPKTPYICCYCNKKFKRAGSLTQHKLLDARCKAARQTQQPNRQKGTFPYPLGSHFLTGTAMEKFTLPFKAGQCSAQQGQCFSGSTQSGRQCGVDNLNFDQLQLGVGEEEVDDWGVFEDAPLPSVLPEEPRISRNSKTSMRQPKPNLIAMALMKRSVTLNPVARNRMMKTLIVTKILPRSRARRLGLDVIWPDIKQQWPETWLTWPN